MSFDSKLAFGFEGFKMALWRANKFASTLIYVNTISPKPYVCHFGEQIICSVSKLDPNKL